MDAKGLCNLTISESTENLWKKFCRGEREALNLIYQGHVEDLYHYGMHFCRDSDRVKDCLQDLFQCLWLDHEELNSEINNMRYYLITSLRRRLLRSLEKTRRYRTEELGDTFDFEIIPSREEIIIADESHRKQAKEFHERISTLSRRQREAIYLRFYQNLSYEEIAKMMSIRVESVYNIISKAIGLLKNLFLVILYVSTA